MALITDLITKAGNGTRPVPTTLNSILPSGAAPGTASCAALTGWNTATAIHFIIYTIDTNGRKVAGSQTDWKGLVVGSTITGLALKAGTNNGYPVGAIVQAAPTAQWADDLASNLLLHANQDGSLITSAVQAALNLGSSALNGWNPLGYTFTYGANAGQKEFTVTTPSDLSAILYPGMRFKFTRGTTAPTQCMAFASASSQYGTKSSPSGMTFNTALTCEAWVYLNSYGGASNQTIISRYDGVNGFIFNLNSSGQIVMQTVGSSRVAVSYQSVPLQRWVHIAGAINLATGTYAIYMNGVSIATLNSGAAVSFTQAGNLQVGAYNSSNFFNGYIAEARVWSVAQSAANILANMGITLVGTETNLVCLFKGNGNFNDSTSNANNLTATGGAIATQVANPYNNTEYAIITKVAYSSPNTTLTLFGGTDYMVPNMTLSSPQYSTDGRPAGWPDATKWIVDMQIWAGAFTTAFGALNVWQAAPGSFVVPIGPWKIKYEGSFSLSSTVSGNKSGWFQLAPTAPTNGNYTGVMTSRVFLPASSITCDYLARSSKVVQAAQATWVMYSQIDAAPGAESFSLYGQQGTIVYEAESAYA